MPPIIPNRFLIKLCHPCTYVAKMPNDSESADHLVELPESARIQAFPELDELKDFADIRLAWNEFGLAVQMEIRGKKELPTGDIDRPKMSDGLTLWLDTRDSRTSHRASRYCHQFHFLPLGGGAERDEPAALQTKINRALQDAPLCSPHDILFRSLRSSRGYRIEAFLNATVLTGFDPEQHPRLGIYYHIRDQELGEQFAGVNGDFPIADDPSLWAALELVK